MDALIRCPRCWKRVPEPSRFCRRCGISLQRIAPVPVPAASPGGKGTIALLTLFAVGALALLPILFFGVAVRTSSPQPASAQEYPAPPPEVEPAPTPMEIPPPPAYSHPWQAEPTPHDYHRQHDHR